MANTRITDKPELTKDYDKVVLLGSDPADARDYKITPEGLAKIVSGRVVYDTECTTAAETAAKVITIEGFTELVPGLMLWITFTNGNTAANPTLSVNGQTAIPLKVQGGDIPSLFIEANKKYKLEYIGNEWNFVNQSQSSVELLDNIYGVAVNLDNGDYNVNDLKEVGRYTWTTKVPAGIVIEGRTEEDNKYGSLTVTKVGSGNDRKQVINFGIDNSQFSRTNPGGNNPWGKWKQTATKDMLSDGSVTKLALGTTMDGKEVATVDKLTDGSVTKVADKVTNVSNKELAVNTPTVKHLTESGWYLVGKSFISYTEPLHIFISTNYVTGIESISMSLDVVPRSNTLANCLMNCIGKTDDLDKSIDKIKIFFSKNITCVAIHKPILLEQEFRCLALNGETIDFEPVRENIEGEIIYNVNMGLSYNGKEIVTKDEINNLKNGFISYNYVTKKLPNKDLDKIEVTGDWCKENFDSDIVNIPDGLENSPFILKETYTSNGYIKTQTITKTYGRVRIWARNKLGTNAWEEWQEFATTQNSVKSLKDNATMETSGTSDNSIMNVAAYNKRAYKVGPGRNLMTVLGASSLTDLASKIKALGTDYSLLQPGDYISIPSLEIAGIGTVQNVSGNLDFEIAGFDHYNGVGDTDSGRGILFVNKNCMFRHRMNPLNSDGNHTNAGGYNGCELKGILNGAVAEALEKTLGVSLKTVHRLVDTHGSWAWAAEKCFLPTEVEIFSYQAWGRGGYYGGTSAQYPIYALDPSRRCKKYNGARQWYWEGTSDSSSSTYFCLCGDDGCASNSYAGGEGGGVSPAFYL